MIIIDSCPPMTLLQDLDGFWNKPKCQIHMRSQAVFGCVIRARWLDSSAVPLGLRVYFPGHENAHDLGWRSLKGFELGL